MTTPTRSGLADLLLTLVHEGTYLWEITLEVREYLGYGPMVNSNPWRSDGCRDMLLRWFDAGWLDCRAIARTYTLSKPDEIHEYRYDTSWQHRASLVDDAWVLARSDGRHLIASPGLWTAKDQGGNIWPHQTDTTIGLTDTDWLAAVADVEQEQPG